MVKFFLKNDKNPPKSQLASKGSNSKKTNQKSKKVLDYRIVIWKKLFNLIKAEHSIMIQKVIRKIKEKKNKISEISQQQEKEESNKQRIASLQKEIQKLDANYEKLKQQKKHQLKLITIYLILEVLKIPNVDKIMQKAKITANDIKQIKSIVQNNQSHKKFVEKLSMLTIYQQQLEKCAQLVDTVQEKKLERKEKIKERKNRKYQRQHGIIPQKENNEMDSIQEKSQKQSEPQPKQKVQNKKNNFLTKIKEQKKQKYQDAQTKNTKIYDKKRESYKVNSRQQNQTFQKNKPIHRQRTQFKKTGRNKVKHQKEQRKHNQYRNQENKVPNKQSAKGNNKQFNFSKEMAHPSWQAKQQQKQEVFIKPFQGKKILL